MKEREQQNHFQEADERYEDEQNEKVKRERAEVPFAEAERTRPPARNGSRTEKYDVEQKMHGDIEHESNQRAGDAVDGEEYRYASAKGISAKDEHGGRHGKPYGVHARDDNEREKDGIPCGALQKYYEYAFIGKANAPDKAVAEV